MLRQLEGPISSGMHHQKEKEGGRQETGQEDKNLYRRPQRRQKCNSAEEPLPSTYKALGVITGMEKDSERVEERKGEERGGERRGEAPGITRVA